MSLIVFIFHFQLILPRLRNKILYDKQQTPEPTKVPRCRVYRHT